MHIAAAAAHSGRPRWQIGRNVAWALIGFCLVSLLSFTMSTILLRQLTDAHRWVHHTREIQSTINEVTWDITAIDSGMKGFALTGDDAQLGPYREGEAEIGPDLARLSALTKDPDQQVRIAEFARVVEKHLDSAAAVVAVRRSEGLEPARSYIHAMDDRHLWALAKEMETTADRKLLGRLGNEQKKSTLAFVAIGLSGLLALGLVAFAALLLNRALVTREKVLGEKEDLLAQKDLLMREVDHRVRNSLMLVHSLLTLRQRNAGQAARCQLEEAASRVLTIARVHERLYKSASLDRVDLAAYLGEICDGLAESLLPAEERRALRFNATDSVTIAPERAVSLGLVVTELVTNAIKYGAPDHRRPIRVTVSADRDHCEVAVADQGPGLPEGFELEKSGGLGMQVINLLVRQLQGQLHVDCAERGARFAVTFAPQEAGDAGVPDDTAFPEKRAA
jgi:two-component sensor histidine kinase